MKHPRPWALLAALLALLASFVLTAGAAGVPPTSEAASPEMQKLAAEAATEVEALRGWKFKAPVATKMCSPEDVRAYLDREIDKQYPPEKVAQVQAFLRTVGLLPPGCDLRKTFLDIMQNQVGGFYDTDTKTLYMVKRGEAKMLPIVERSMLAHELTHALDDQYIDLDKFVKSRIGQSEDMDLVTEALIEGSATSLMSQYMVRAQFSGKYNIAELQQYALEEMERSKPLLEAPRYFSAMLGAYLVGTAFLARGEMLSLMLAPDNKTVGERFLAAVKDPPRSSEQILHPEKYWDAAARDGPVIVSDDDVAKTLARPGRFIVHKDTIGEMLCAVLTTPKDAKLDLMAMNMSSYWTNPAATGWGGDRFFLLASGSSADDAGKTLKDLRAVWITLWDTPKDRDEFVEAYEQLGPAGRATFKYGNQGAVFFFGFDEAERKAVQSALEKSPPKMTRNGKPWTPWAP